MATTPDTWRDAGTSANWSTAQTNEQEVEFYSKHNSPGADALYDSYLMRLQAEVRSVGVVLTLDDNTRLS